ncbi:uncharacterized protein LOC124930741 [Impatiens glandulifera]|uniref:uncharacterized protein LOC124930741 n=1 Tax=Impatiens glandulifera TaxID=253017 RepID=UPI001FB12198|nr:uncharacterized protein LOC124930741 [Impatiens glandulifera]
MEDNGAVSRFGTRIHITALDGIIHVNSLFTIAVFIGLAWQPTDPNADFVDDPTCAATVKIAEDLVVFHVYSFSSFLFSSIIALGLKQVIRMVKPVNDNHRRIFTIEVAHINRTALRIGYLVSAIGSASGCICLMLALINMVQIKLGTFGCGSIHIYGAVVPLLILVPSALLFYVCVVFYAFTR